MVSKSEWMWMPHAGHFICVHKCRFHLNTWVGKYIVSTVGEYLPDSQVREIIAKVKKIQLEGKGDDRETDFLRKEGFVEIGLDRLYETMVFKAKKSGNRCCPYEMENPNNVDFLGYNKPSDAVMGHLKMCKKWARMKS